MAVINFPSSPSINDQYSANGIVYTWDGDAWTAATEYNLDLDIRYVETGGDTMTGNLTVPSLNGGPLAGFRNILINGNLTINQRGIPIDASSAIAIGDYGQDRWKKTAGGMTQIVESGNFEPSATYTLSGTDVTEQQLTAPATGDWTLPDIPLTARKIQLEPGPVATPFEQRPIGLELSLCQRYYYNFAPGNDNTFGVGFNNSASSTDVPIKFPVTLRSVPTMTTATAVTWYQIIGIDCDNLPSQQKSGVDISMVRFYVASGLAQNDPSIVTSGNARSFLAFDAEL